MQYVITDRGALITTSLMVFCTSGSREKNIINITTFLVDDLPYYYITVNPVTEKKDFLDTSLELL